MKKEASIGVLLASDHILLRAGLCALLHMEPDVEVVGEALDEEETLTLAARLEPDIILMDVLTSGEGGIGSTRKLKALFPDIRIIILAGHEDLRFLREVIRAGASGYIITKAARSELIGAIHAIRRGDLYVHPSMTRFLLKGYSPVSVPGDSTEKKLTRREIEVLRYIAQGHTNRQIAEKLFVSVRTIESHRANLLGKLNARCRVELVKYAVALGLK